MNVSQNAYSMASSLVFAVFAVLPACGGSSSSTTGGPGSHVSGTVAGKPVPNNDAVGIYESVMSSVNGQSVAVTVAGVAITSIEGACAAAKANSNVTGSLLFLEVAGTPSSVVGTFSFAGTTTASTALAYGEYSVDGTTCTGTVQSGTLTIASADSSDVTGSFDVTLTTGDRLSGSFSVPVCSIPTTAAGSTATIGMATSSCH